MRKVLSAVAIAVGLTMIGAPAFADPPLQVKPSKVRPGDEISVSGRCPSHRGGTVEITLAGKHVVKVRADRKGRFSGEGTVPDVKPGKREVRAIRGRETCGDKDITVLGHAPVKFSVIPRRVERGGVVTISGGGCKPGSKVIFYLDGRKIGAKTSSRRDGSFHDTATIPTGTSLGKHTITAVCNGKVVGSAKIRVVEGYPGTGGRSSTLAVSRSTVAAGTTVSLVTTPCPTGTADAALNDTKLVLASPARSGGLFSTTIPKGTPAGTYTLAARCDGRVAGVATVRVIPAAEALPAQTTGLPSTRANIVPGLAAGAALIVAGALTLLRIKRRRGAQVVR